MTANLRYTKGAASRTRISAKHYCLARHDMLQISVAGTKVYHCRYKRQSKSSGHSPCKFIYPDNETQTQHTHIALI